LQRYHRLAGKFARALDLNEMTFNVITGWDDHVTINRQRSIQRGMEGLALLTGFGVDGIDQPYRQRCA